jgi:hypothetical protein
MKKGILLVVNYEIIARKGDGGIGSCQGGAHTALQLKVRITEAGHDRWKGFVGRA